jgi:hypothetical protein
VIYWFVYGKINDLLRYFYAGLVPDFLFPTFALKVLLMSDQLQQPNQLNIEISEEVAEGNYANLAIITHSHAEFVVDFVNVMPGTPKSKVKSRIILTPQHAKRLMKALIDNVEKFETTNGVIKDLDEVQIPLNFGGPNAQA